MKYKKAKLFWRLEEYPKVVHCLTMDESEEYYAFLKRCYLDGFRQIIITSEIMIKLIEYFTMEVRYSIYSIEFMEEDTTLNIDMKELIDLVDSNAAYLSKVIEKLNFLSEKSSIDIKRMYFKGRNKEKKPVNFFVQSNGILGIDEKNFDNTSKEINRLIERYLF